MTDPSASDERVSPASQSPTRQAHYWHRHTAGSGVWRTAAGGPPGEDLAALRRGIGREPGAAPAMWRLYTQLTEDGRVSRQLRAEHAALTLFAVHQQSRSAPMHRKGAGVGTAVLALRRSGRYSEEAVDRRFAAAATATSLAEVTVHLRGLLTQLRTVNLPLDYDALYRDLREWQDPQRRGAVRRRWGSQYSARLNAAEVEQADVGTGAAAPS